MTSLEEHWFIETEPRVISIVGPTASGKTALAIHLAQQLETAGQHCEIVNQDAYQMYRQMTIGTAKPSAEELSQVPHHLIDVINPDEVMSVAHFQAMARACIHDLQVKHIRPILVGGSGLYARAAIDQLNFTEQNLELRSQLEERAHREGTGVLFHELSLKDPLSAAKIGPSNTRRIIRALEVIITTGRPYSSSLPTYQYALPCVQIGLDIDRTVLDQIIDRRTHLMRELGFVQEAETLRPILSVTAIKAIGYQQIFDYLDGKMSEDDAFAVISQKTKRLARKQMGWFGRDPRIHWINGESSTVHEQAYHIVQLADAGFYDESDLGVVSPTVRHLGSFTHEDEVHN